MQPRGERKERFSDGSGGIMCAIFELAFNGYTEELREIALQLNERYGASAADRLGGNYYPKMDAPALGANGRYAFLGWGFPREGKKSVLFNARGETVSRLPAFRPYLGNRCLIPATAFFEWGGDGIKYKIAFDIPLFYLAALWRPVRLPGGEKSFRFVIVTTQPNKTIAKVHGRMPVVLAPEEKTRWLAGGETQALLRPFERKTTLSAESGTMKSTVKK